MHIGLLITILSLFAVNSSALSIDRYQSPNPESRKHYSNAISVEGGRTIYISGQTAYDVDQRYEDFSFEEQVAISLENLRAALSSAGASPADVVQIRSYVKDFRRERHLPTLNAALTEFFPTDQLPTSVLIGVTSLAQEHLLYEIEAVAVVQ